MTTIERVKSSNKEEVSKLKIAGKKELKDSFARSSQSELVDLLLQGNKHTFHSTGDIVKVSGTIGENKVFDIFATTTEGTKLKLSKAHMDSLDTLTKDKEVNVILRFNEVKETELTKNDGETEPAFEERKNRQANLLKYRVEFEGKKGYVIFDNIAW